MAKLYYYGTSMLDTKKQLWEGNRKSLQRADKGKDDLPFDPEEFPVAYDGEKSSGNLPPKGTWEVHHRNGWTILAISGSCRDPKQGTRTIFFINDKYEAETMFKMVRAVPPYREVLKQVEYNFKLKKRKH